MFVPSDQDLAQLRDVLPRIWWAIFKGSIQVGFTEQQSFSLTQTYILSQGRVTPTDPYIKPEDDDAKMYV